MFSSGKIGFKEDYFVTMLQPVKPRYNYLFTELKIQVSVFTLLMVTNLVIIGYTGEVRFHSAAKRSSSSQEEANRVPC